MPRALRARVAKAKADSRRRYLLDLLERTASTYAETFLALLIASGFGVDQITDMAVWQKAAVAALPAALAVVKGALAKNVGSPESASVLAADTDPPQAGLTADSDPAAIALAHLDDAPPMGQ